MKKILFTGELPPNIYHGVSLSNRINLDLLSSKFDITVDEEITFSQDHKKTNLSKILYNLKRLKKAIIICKFRLFIYYISNFKVWRFKNFIIYIYI